MIADGFAQSAQADAAARNPRRHAGPDRNRGFSEYFDPNDGNGAGGEAFSWTAAIYCCCAPEPAIGKFLVGSSS